MRFKGSTRSKMAGIYLFSQIIRLSSTLSPQLIGLNFCSQSVVTRLPSRSLARRLVTSLRVLIIAPRTVATPLECLLDYGHLDPQNRFQNRTQDPSQSRRPARNRARLSP